MGRHSGVDLDSTSAERPRVVGIQEAPRVRPQAGPFLQPLQIDNGTIIVGLILAVITLITLVIGLVQAAQSSSAPALGISVVTGIALFLLAAQDTHSARLHRAAVAADRDRRATERQQAFLAQIERNYRMEVELGWRPQTGYDVATEASRFSSAGAFNGLPRPAIWSYSDGLGGTPVRTPGGAVGVLNRRYGPLTPGQWAGVAAVAAWGLEHHHHNR